MRLGEVRNRAGRRSRTTLVSCPSSGVGSVSSGGSGVGGSSGGSVVREEILPNGLVKRIGIATKPTTTAAAVIAACVGRPRQHQVCP